MIRLHRLVAPVFLAGALAACASSPGAAPNAAGHLARLPQPPACAATDDLQERLVIDWSPLERARLESAARRGLVFVRVTGCAAQIVDACSSNGRYAYSPTSRQREVTTMRDADEISTRLPLGAARFAASVGTSAALNVSMTVVGRYESPPAALTMGELAGDCGGVTHVVASLSVGSFEISSASDARIAGATDIMFVADARAESGAARRHLDSAGIEARCAEARRTDTSPPDDCGIPLRLELRRLGAYAPTATLVNDNEANASAAGRRAPTELAPIHPDDMRRASAMARAEIAPCYRRALAADAALAGTLTLMVSVGREGRVKSVSARGDVPDALTECAVNRIERVTFPAGDPDEERPRMFVVPFVFSARS